MIKQKRLFFNFKYPKLATLLLMIIAAYFLFANAYVKGLISGLESFAYFGTFAAGLFFSFGFSTPLAIGFFLVSAPGNIFLAALAGGFGAMLSDLLIFKFVKFSMMDELNRIRDKKSIKELRLEIKKYTSRKILNYLTYIFAGIIIASPLPDEIGVSMLAGLTEINPLF